MESKELKPLPVKPYMPGELANYYQVSEKTFRCWLTAFTEKLGKRNGRYFTIKQVELIFQELGIPKTIEL